MRTGDVFADVGCGKGLVVCVAARRRYARVIGVEVDDHLATIARMNSERDAPRRRAGAVEVVAADASTWAVPDDLTVLYLFCPFSGVTLDRFVAGLIASLDRRPRRLTVIYALPLLEQRFVQTERFRVERRLQHGWRKQPVGRVSILRST